MVTLALISIVWGTACGGGSGAKTPTHTARPVTATATAPRTAVASPTNVPVSTLAAATSSSSAGAATTPPTTDQVAPAPATPAPPVAPPPPTSPVPAVGKVYGAAQGQAQVNAASLTPSELPAGWKVQTDIPGSADADATSCGWLSGRTVFNLPADPVSAFLAGQTLAFFSTSTAYANDAGAIDCSARAAAKFKSPADVARAFGPLFINPDAVTGAVFDYPQVADGSFAGTLTGQISVSGTTIDLTVLLVTFRKGNVTAVIGSARSGSTPPANELTPLINLVIGRIAANQ